MLKTPRAKAPKKAKAPAAAPQQSAHDAVTEALQGAGLTKNPLANALAAWDASRADAASDEEAIRSLVQRLRTDKQHTAAEAVARLAKTRFAASAWPLLDLAALRTRAGDHEAVLSYARQTRRCFSGRTRRPPPDPYGAAGSGA